MRTTQKEKMKREIIFKKGTVGRLSETGYYNYWYPGSGQKYKTSITEDVECKHLFSWKNQGEYLAFKVPAFAVNTLNDLEDHKFVCLWVLKEDVEKACNESVNKLSGKIC